MNPQVCIRIVVQALFPRFDANNSGGLDVPELANFFNASFKELGYNITVTQEDAFKAMSKLDKNADRAVNREEIFIGLKEILIPGGVPVKPDFPPPAGGILAQAQQQGGQQGGQQQPGQGQPGQQGQWGQQGQQGGQQGQWNQQGGQQGGQQGQWGQPGQQGQQGQPSQQGQPGQQGQWK